jgi:hypothetical protein
MPTRKEAAKLIRIDRASVARTALGAVARA